jgi:carbamoylphosphate synthase large subunit
MTLAFYGKHSDNWMAALLHPSLVNALQPKIHTIQNVSSLRNVVSYDYIMPLMEVHMLALHARGIRAMMPDVETVRMCMCKRKFSQYVLAHNLTQYAPKTLEADNGDGSLRIVKPYSQNSGSGMRITRDVRKEEYRTRVVQEYIPNREEYCAFIVANKGRIVHCTVIQSMFSESVHIKQAISAEDADKNRIVTLDRAHIDSLEMFLLPCSYTGVCNIDFLLHEDVVKVFEINPRLGGSLMFPKHRHILVEILLVLLDIFDKEIRSKNNPL